MTVTLTCRFKLELSKDQKQQFLDIATAYTNAVNYVLEQNFKDKSTNVKKLHRLYYSTIREKFSLPAQIAINVNRDVSAMYKTLWAQFKELKRRKPDSKAVKKFWDKPPKRKSLIVKYTYNRTASFKKVNGEWHASLSTLQGRIKWIPMKGWSKHFEYLESGKIGDPILTYDKSSKTFFLLVPVTLEVQEQPPKEIVGVDVGERHIVAVASTRGTRYLIDLPEEFKQRKQHYQRLRSELMSKGTRSAKRKLARISRREKRFTENVLHIIAKKLITNHPGAKFVLEDLTYIKANRITYRGKDKEARRQSEQWPFASLQQKIEYKSKLYYGVQSEKVDPAYTSQTCPVCGHVSKENRPDHGERFICQNCGYEEHADIVGAINIALKVLAKDQQVNLENLLRADVSRPNAPSS
ncbi:MULTISPECIES: RNA-guided endonuclease InsQ/TnpB family protein [Thermotoga]|jgi:putative transposase|uniref:Transposase, putative n=3 Tax=Thermotoga petrophila TaxID=93929 RepID=A5IIZ1_THEP1|nr:MULTISPECIES: RNA-guided endonuclease TnpB family protein [Thermotoga]KUK23665.1 MAG: Transposase [Thermotoga petrophila]MBZ4660968.1 transposase [Thermotoga sp.]ABQ46164.1 transposase, putative [Thermotoga petrophila RKU-1]ACB08494.1 transposase [Thermotoga sp. RQ2]ADA66241.1 transposase [Thermotoga petrophila RKU-10]